VEELGVEKGSHRTEIEPDTWLRDDRGCSLYVRLAPCHQPIHPKSTEAGKSLTLMVAKPRKSSSSYELRCCRNSFMARVKLVRVRTCHEHAASIYLYYKILYKYIKIKKYIYTRHNGGPTHLADVREHGTDGLVAVAVPDVHMQHHVWLEQFELKVCP
jgi:hypothetical protein